MESFMRFTPLDISGAVLIEPDLIVDDRGFFAMIWSSDELARKGLNPRLEQANLSYNRQAGTVRGMHYQCAPDEETKLVRCQSGAVYDVVLDLRRDSPSFGRWQGVELSATNRAMLYLPEGCAHGFQTLKDDTEVFYLLSKGYAAGSARGVRWDDPAFDIRWPIPVSCISDRDLIHPPFA